MITIEPIPFIGYALVFMGQRTVYSDMCAKEADRSGGLFCAKIGEAFAGYICVADEGSGDRISYAYTVPEFRRMGVFSALVGHVRGRAARRLRAALRQKEEFRGPVQKVLLRAGFQPGETLNIFSCKGYDFSLWDDFKSRRGDRICGHLKRRGYSAVSFADAGEDIQAQIRNSGTFNPSLFLDRSEKKMAADLSFAAVKDGRLAAYVLMSRPDQGKVILELLWEDEEFRGRGIIFLPFAAAIDACEARGIRNGFWAVYSGNDPAFAFIEKLPFPVERSMSENYCYYI